MNSLIGEMGQLLNSRSLMTLTCYLQTHTMEEDNLTEKLALIILDQGDKKYVKGEYGEALKLYQRSIDTCPTAAAYVALGRAYSRLGQREEAITMCHHAIKTDPDLGVPYNDLGVYLMEMEKWKEAIQWFEKAIQAPLYETSHHSYFNLGRIYTHLGDWQSGLAYYALAHKAEPLYMPASWAKYEMLGRLN